jgi:hypothetical protein
LKELKDEVRANQKMHLELQVKEACLLTGVEQSARRDEE